MKDQCSYRVSFLVPDVPPEAIPWVVDGPEFRHQAAMAEDSTASGTPTIPAPHMRALRAIWTLLDGVSARWAVTGSLGMALQGVSLPVHDIDLQTDTEGAYAIERRLGQHIVHPVRWVESDRLRSHLGTFAVLGIKVEVIGDIEKLGKDGKWEAPPDLAAESLAMRVGDMTLQVMSLAYEAAAYDKVGRHERAALLRRWLDRDVSNDG